MPLKSYGFTFGQLKDCTERFDLAPNGQENYSVDFTIKWVDRKLYTPKRGDVAPGNPGYYFLSASSVKLPPDKCRLSLVYSTAAQTRVIPEDDYNESASSNMVSIKQHPKFQSDMIVDWDEKNDQFKLNSNLRGHESYRQGGVVIQKTAYYKFKVASNRDLIGKINDPDNGLSKRWLITSINLSKSGQWEPTNIINKGINGRTSVVSASYLGDVVDEYTNVNDPNTFVQRYTCKIGTGNLLTDWEPIPVKEKYEIWAESYAWEFNSSKNWPQVIYTFTP
jgi:hypothetical protein